MFDSGSILGGLVILGVMCGIVGWGFIELCIWLGSFVTISLG